jgi:DNA-binding HxlR family transcriptional regulator
VVLYHLFESGVLRFNKIRRLLSSVTQRMLTNQLREMEADGLIARKVYPEVPPKWIASHRAAELSSRSSWR